MQTTLTVNNKAHSVEVDADTPLLWVLRDTLGMTGTKFSCGKGLCGSCTVLVDQKPVRSCITPMSELKDRQVTTIEGIDAQHPIVQAWQKKDVPQCGYCQSGQILSAVSLFDQAQNRARPSDGEIKATMTNLCRCGSYPEIKQAIDLTFRQTEKEA
ncbi:MAG: (2Fe-2S)-binding protein [Hydrogenovibrio sp.]|uniref:(2Fe-2S)-binding protein n=1 Tax=Hydrogenovibrio sp. TaxID=2065821 RepID=UPI00287022EF|nr:2Fe-2S iron-sulfur cluster-binding protein [Hydrogenovibrio sp.]MDR9499389.1 (2Fe-2S)-binding protein [Hydrogenovibrio sp.]